MTWVNDTLSWPLYYLGIQVLNIFHLIVFLGGGEYGSSIHLLQLLILTF